MRLVARSVVAIALDTAAAAVAAAAVLATATGCTYLQLFANRQWIMDGSGIVDTGQQPGASDRFHCSGPTRRMLDRKREAKV